MTAFQIQVPYSRKLQVQSLNSSSSVKGAWGTLTHIFITLMTTRYDFFNVLHMLLFAVKVKTLEGCFELDHPLSKIGLPLVHYFHPIIQMSSQHLWGLTLLTSVYGYSDLMREDWIMKALNTLICMYNLVTTHRGSEWQTTVLYTMYPELDWWFKAHTASSRLTPGGGMTHLDMWFSS